MMARLLTTLALLCLATYALGAVTFYLNEGTKKCFIEDLPKDTLVVAAYRAADIDSAKWAPDGVSRRGLTEVIGIKVHCTGPTQEVVAQRVTGEVGKVAFTSKHAGEHEICFQSNSTRWFGSGSLVRTAQCTLPLARRCYAHSRCLVDHRKSSSICRLVPRPRTTRTSRRPSTFRVRIAWAHAYTLTRTYSPGDILSPLSLHRDGRYCVSLGAELEMLVRRLNDRVADIRREQAYFKVSSSSAR